MKKYIKHIGIMFITGILVACGGGGGGGGGGSTPSTANLGGTFGKGLYANADVQAYEYINGVKTSLGSKVLTDANGSYKLIGLPLTSNPVVVEMTTSSSTTMLDETRPLVGGKFQNSAQPPKIGTTIRTMVSDLTNSQEVHGNPFTEMAVNAAEKSGSINTDSFAASKAFIQQVLGDIDPFSIKATNADASLDTRQEKMMTLLTGLMLEANAVSCSGDPTGVSCLTLSLNQKAELVKSADGTTFTPKTASSLQTTLQNSTDRVRTSNANSFVTARQSSANSIKSSITAPASINTADARQKQGLDSFISAMRTGFNEAQETIEARKNAAQLRLDSLIFRNVGDGLNLLSTYTDTCSIQSSIFTCPTGAGTIFTATSSGYSFTYNCYEPVNSVGCTISNSNNSNYTISGTISAEGSQISGNVSANITASKIRRSDSKVFSEFSLSVNGTGLTETSLAATINISTFKIKAYDQTANSNKWALVNLSDFQLTGTRTAAGNSGLGTINITAPISITTSDGDNITGKIKSLIAKEKVTNYPFAGNKQQFPTYLSATINVAAKEGALVGIDVSASQDIENYNPDLPSTSSNKQNGKAEIKFTASDNVSVVLNASKSSATYDETSASIKVTSNKNWIDFSAKTKRGNILIDSEDVVGDVIATSSGTYNAKVRKTNGSVSGEVFNGTTQIGVIENGLIKVAGMIVSLK